MLKRIEGKQACAITAQHCAGSEHFGINQRPTRQQPMEKPAMPIGPLHHRSDTKAPPADLSAFLWILSHLLFSTAVSCRTVSSAFWLILKPPVRRRRTLGAVSYHGNDYRTDSQRRLKGFYRPDSHQESRRHRPSRGADIRSPTSRERMDREP